MMIKLVLLKLFKHILSRTQCSFRTDVNIYYHNFIYSKLQPYFHRAFNLVENPYKYSDSNIIWMFWWQGMKNMPSIVSSCVHSVKYHANGYRVVVITKYNIAHYARLPSLFYQKLNNGEITLTHFSDILRFNLLDMYGGLWIDSTIYCTSNISNYYFTPFYTSGGYKNPFKQFVSAKWTGFLIGGDAYNPIFQFMNYFFKLYWRDNSIQWDYFLIDYALYYVYQNNIGNFKNYVDYKAYKNNPHLYALVNLLDYKYDKGKFLSITCDTNMFKLTYKKKFSKNRNTFYNKVLYNEI